MFELMDVAKVITLNSSLIRVPVGRPAVVAIDPGKGALQAAQPVCEVICELLSIILAFSQFLLRYYSFVQ